MRDLLEKLDQITEFKSFDVQTPHQRERNFQKIKHEVGQLPFPRPDIAKTKQVFNNLLNTDLHGSPSDDWIEATFYGLLGKKFKFPKMYTPSGKVIDSAGQSGIDNFEETEADEESAVRQNNSGLFPKEVYDSNSQYKKWFEYNTKNIAAVPPGVIDVTNDDPGEDKDKQAGVQSFGNDDEEWAKPLSKAEKMRAGLTDYSGDNDAEGGVQSAGDGSHSGGKQTIKWNGKNVEVPTANNYKDWLKRGQEILDKYIEMLDKDGHLPSSFKSKGTVDPGLANAKNKTESNQSIKSLFNLLESSFREKKLLQQSWKEYKRIMLKALKNLPGEARDAFKGQTQQKDKLDTGAKAYADTEDPALGVSSSFDSGTSIRGTFTGNADEVEKGADRYLEKIGSIVLNLDKNDLKNSIPKGADDVEVFLLKAKLPTKEITKYNAKYYSLVANNLGLKGFINGNKIIFADGSSEETDPNNETHKEIAQAQHDLGALRLGDARKMFGVDDLPKDSGMSLQTQAAQGFKRDEVQWNGKPVPALNKYNWRDWIKLGQALLTRMTPPALKKESLTIAESIRYSLNLLLEDNDQKSNIGKQNAAKGDFSQYKSLKPVTSADLKNYEIIKQQFAKVGNDLPPEAQQAWEELNQKLINTVSASKEKKGQSTGSLRAMAGSDIEQKDAEGEAYINYGDYYKAVANVARRPSIASLRAADKLMDELGKEEDTTKNATLKSQMYGSIAKKLGKLGIFDISGDVLSLAETEPITRGERLFQMFGTEEKRLFKNGRHKTVDAIQVQSNPKYKALAQELNDMKPSLLPKPWQIKLGIASHLAGPDPNSEEKTATGAAPVQVTLKGKMHLNKELPPLSSKTVEDYKEVYRKILRRYTAGTGKGRSYSKVPESSSANSIRQILNILSEAGAKMSSADLEDLTAIENAFKAAEKRKLITPQEVADFAPLISSKEQLTNQLKYDPKKQGNVPDTLKKAMAIKAPGSDTNYGVFNDQVMAVLNNPTPENLIKQAEAVSAMDLDGIDTDRMKFSAFYGHVANAMGLSGMITHRNSFMNSPMVVSAKARKTDFSDMMPEMLPFGEYSVEAVDFDNPRHKAVAQAQLNKNLLPASIQMSRNNTVDDVYKRFGITKQEPQEPVKTGDVSPTVKSGEPGKSTKSAKTGDTQADRQATADPALDQAFQPEPDAYQRPDFTGTRRELPPTDKLHYERFIPLPVEINSLLRLSKKRQYYVDRVRDSKSNAGANLSDTLNIVNQDTAKGGSYNIARQVSQDMSEDAYKAIIDMLKSRNLEFIDQAQADKFAQYKATNADLDAQGDPMASREPAYYMGPGKEGLYTVYDAVGTKISTAQEKPKNLPDRKTYDRLITPDPEEGGDLWSQSQSGKDAIAKKQAAQARKYAWNNPDGPDSSGSGVGSPGARPASVTGTGKRPGKAVYHDIIGSSGQMRKKTWAEYDANGEVVRKGKEGEKYPGKLPSKNEYRARQSGSGQGPGHSYGTNYHPTRQEQGHSYGTNYHPTTPDKPKEVPNNLSTSDQDEIEKLRRLTGNAGAPAEVNPLNQEPNPPTNTDPTSTGDVPERYKIQQITDANRKTQWKVIDSENAIKPVKIVDTKDEAMKVANQFNNQAAKESGVGSDSSSPANVDTSAQQNSLGKVIDQTRQQLDQEEENKNQENNNTDFTRLLKNAGLLKEFY